MGNTPRCVGHDHSAKMLDGRLRRGFVLRGHGHHTAHQGQTVQLLVVLGRSSAVGHVSLTLRVQRRLPVAVLRVLAGDNLRNHLVGSQTRRREDGKERKPRPNAVDWVCSADRSTRGVLHVGNPCREHQDGRVLQLPTLLAAALAGRDFEHPLHHGATADGIFEVGAVDLLDMCRSATNLDVGRRSRLWHGLQFNDVVFNLPDTQYPRILPLVQ